MIMPWLRRRAAPGLDMIPRQIFGTKVVGSLFHYALEYFTANSEHSLDLATSCDYNIWDSLMKRQ